ncbi:putative alpha-1,2-mannosidase [Saccharothrix tamanrassetensis]|uniref:Putative alpha-1,2-mannosidase n=1 Tax=Saccharothrix tamanrassetensis TaxID=1051531 RepID=A0A841CGN5_9PSEU|nr:GH92 family glycosyl hydrolase [Saccharothrix tamanrassetensis]MBB5955338.1 putative alpha-1,2-mannosidase [Saccharothrix tamanrassetensis]
MKAALATAAVVALALVQPVAAQARSDDLARWVNPFVGTQPGGPDHGTGGGAGNNFPGADVPFGMVQWSPDTVTRQHGGYSYQDNRIKGFSLTHLSGAGCSTYQDIPIMPFVGEVTTSPAADPNRYVATFSHAKESATPGYYGVALDSGAEVELSVTQRTGVGRLAYPGGATSTLLVNTSGSISGTDDAEITIGTDSLSGWATSGRFCGADHRYRVYFHARFDQPFASVGTWKNGAVTPGRTSERGGSPRRESGDARKTLAAQNEQRPIATQDTTVSGPGSGGYVTFDDPDVTMRVGLSFVSVDGAKKNLDAENTGKSFDTIHTAARKAWNDRLNQVKVTGGTDAQRTTFYTALYHSLLQPNVFSDVDGRYPGFDGRVHTVEQGHAIYTNFSGWDVYRSEMQLLSLLAPKESSDMVRSMVAFAEQGGSWDRWTVANGYTGVMVGDPYHVMVSSAYAFGARDFDANKALLLMLRGATQPTQGYEERPGLEEYQELGYVPVASQGVWGAPATTLEYTTADFSIAELARRLGDGATWQTFMKRAQYWQNVFNPATGYTQARNRDGSFVEPFTPGNPDNWVEGNAAQYTWMVPYNARGLFTAMGGDAKVRDRLDFFFTKLNAGPDEPHAFLGNEPIMHTLWLYNWAGAPSKTQDVVRRAVDQLFGPGPDGLMGNDDLGQMSSWYVWAAMGMYPVIPGRAELVVNSPLFEEVTITRPNGEPIVIKASGAGKYVSGLKLNGRAQTRTWLPESLVANGGTVEFGLSAEPTAWGTGPADAPPSFREGEVGQQGFIEPGRLVLPAGASGTVTIGAQDFSGKGGKVTWNAQPPNGITLTPVQGEITVPAGEKVGQRVQVDVAPTAAEQTHRIPIAFSNGQRSTISVLVADPGSLRAAFNNVGTSPDDNQAIGNFDGQGWSYSREALGEEGLLPGATVTQDGITYTWPKSPVGEPDNATSTGQTVTVDATGTKLGLLGSGGGGKASGTLTVTYADGTTQTADVGFSDWALGGNSSTPPSFGNRVVAETAYRNNAGGTPQELAVFVFATAPIALQPKQVRSVTLPASVTGGTFHVFAIGVG